MTSAPETETDLLNFAARFAGRLPPQDIENARDLISRREWGVGLELLCTQLAEHEIALTASEAAELRRLASSMNLDVSSFGLAD